MLLRGHLALSTAAGGATWAATGDPVTLPISVAAGVLPDSDHLIDYFNWYVRRDFNRLLLLFHGWEYLAGLVGLYLFVWTEPWMLAVVVGYFTQIGADQVFNQPYWHTYLITSRVVRRFRAQSVIRGGLAVDTYLALVNSLPFWRRRLTDWFEARIAQVPADRRPPRGRDRDRTGGG